MKNYSLLSFVFFTHGHSGICGHAAGTPIGHKFLTSECAGTQIVAQRPLVSLA